MILRFGKTIVFFRKFKIIKLRFTEKKYFYTWENSSFAYNIYKKDDDFETAINKVMNTIYREYYGNRV